MVNEKTHDFSYIRELDMTGGSICYGEMGHPKKISVAGSRFYNKDDVGREADTVAFKRSQSQKNGFTAVFHARDKNRMLL
ncbi:hypothetical protein IAS59_005458 [Cryptococcus gattii]